MAKIIFLFFFSSCFHVPLLIHAAKLFQNKIITKFLFLNYKSILDIFFRLNMKQIKFISCVLWLSHSYVNYGGFWIMHQLLQNIICILERTWNMGGGEKSKVVTKSLSGKCLILPLNIRRGGRVQKYPSKETFRALASSLMDDSNLLSSYT